MIWRSVSEIDRFFFFFNKKAFRSNLMPVKGDMINFRRRNFKWKDSIRNETKRNRTKEREKKMGVNKIIINKRKEKKKFNVVADLGEPEERTRRDR